MEFNLKGLKEKENRFTLEPFAFIQVNFPLFLYVGLRACKKADFMN